MIARLLRTDVIGMPPSTNMYGLDEPFESFDYVCVTAFEPFEQAFIVGVNESGGIEADTVEALWHSDTYIPHADVLEAIGYTLQTLTE